MTTEAVVEEPVEVVVETVAVEEVVEVPVVEETDYAYISTEEVAYTYDSGYSSSFEVEEDEEIEINNNNYYEEEEEEEVVEEIVVDTELIEEIQAIAEEQTELVVT